MRFLLRTNILEPITALADVNLEVHPGQVCAVVGPNGAGKTTMFRILTGLTTPTAGTATVLGLDAHHESDAVRRVIGWMPAEDRSLFMRLNCNENLYFHGRLHGIARSQLKERIPTLLDAVGLGQRGASSVFSLSAGMRARLQLARALLPQPKLLILDEPTAAIDPMAAHGLLSLIVDLVRDHRLAALISSHRLEEIEALHSHVVLLDKGRVRHQGDLDELRRKWDRPDMEIEFDDPQTARRAAELLIGHATVVPTKDACIRCSVADGVTTGHVLRELSPVLPAIRHVRELPIPLRDLLAQVYRREPLLTGEQR
ncbi:MAG: ABC transporter ATP-binding protein [Actinomycetota bacterium]|nr:ABC transporter ATP-binding protein [Actinomycetota bacterium]